MMRKRPMPPPSVVDAHARSFRPDTFVPDTDVALWARATFIDEGAALLNEEHMHLREANIGVLWTNTPNRRRGRTVIGQAESCPPMVTAGKWLKARIALQLEQWFEEMPDFLITLSAPYADQCSDTQFCALVEHELLHCGQEHDEFGAPKFGKDGRPKFTIRGHDVEEFASVVRRYGATDEATAAFLDAAKKGPTVGRAELAGACGACLKAVA